MECNNVTNSARPIVLQSLESPDGLRCVDIVRYAGGDFGFRECRRDPEDPYGWRPLAGSDSARFDSEWETLSAAKAAVGWLPRK